MSSQAGNASSFETERVAVYSRPQRNFDHRFYTAMSIAIAATVFAGFSPSYYLKPVFQTGELPLLLHIHGVVFSLWIILYVTQNVLVLVGRTNFHRRLGLASVVLAVALVGAGTATAIQRVRGGHFGPFPNGPGMLAVSFAEIFTFAIFFTAGYFKRRDSEAHKRLMLLATVAIFFAPSVGRLFARQPALQILFLIFFLLSGPLFDAITRHRIHAVYRLGIPFLFATIAPFMLIASRVAPWQAFSKWLLQ